MWLRCGFLMFIAAVLVGCGPTAPPPSTTSPNPTTAPTTGVTTGLSPKQCENQPGIYIFIANGPVTRSETRATRPQLYSTLEKLLSKEFASPGSQRAEITLIQLTQRSDSNPVTKFELTCTEPEPTATVEQKQENCQSIYIGTDKECVERNLERKEEFKASQKRFQELKERINADIESNKKVLGAIRKALDSIPPVFPTLDVWGGLSLASTETAKRPQWRRLVVVVAEDEKEGPSSKTYVPGCCNLRDAHFIFAGLATDSLRDTIFRRQAWQWWVEKGEAGSRLCAYTHNEDLLSLFECPGR